MDSTIPPPVKLPDSQKKSAVIDDRTVAGGTGFEPWWDQLNVPAHILEQSKSTNYASAKADYDHWLRRLGHAYRKLANDERKI